MQLSATSKRASPKRAALCLGLAALGVVGLSGCAGEPAAPPATVFVTVEPSPPPAATPEPAPVETPADVPAEVPADPAPPVAVEIEPNAPAAEVVPGPAVDLGAVPGATGPTTAAGDGALLTYTVASGDAFFDIAQRFDLPQQQLLKMNPSIPELGTTLYIGQVINLDWTTTR